MAKAPRKLAAPKPAATNDAASTATQEPQAQAPTVASTNDAASVVEPPATPVQPAAGTDVSAAGAHATVATATTAEIVAAAAVDTQLQAQPGTSSPNTSEMRPGIFVRSIPASIRRAGYRFTQEGMGFAEGVLSEADVLILCADPDLVVEPCEFPAQEQ